MLAQYFNIPTECEFLINLKTTKKTKEIIPKFFDDNINNKKSVKKELNTVSNYLNNNKQFVKESLTTLKYENSSDDYWINDIKNEKVDNSLNNNWKNSIHKDLTTNLKIIMEKNGENNFFFFNIVYFLFNLVFLIILNANYI